MLALSVKPVRDISNYIQLVETRAEGGQTMYLMNTYLQSANHEHELFMESMNTLSDMHEYYSTMGKIIICGDFNTCVPSGIRYPHRVNVDP